MGKLQVFQNTADNLIVNAPATTQLGEYWPQALLLDIFRSNNQCEGVPTKPRDNLLSLAPIVIIRINP